MRKYLNKYTLPKLWRILFFRCHLCGKNGLAFYEHTSVFFIRGCLCRDCFWHTLDDEDEDINEDGEFINFDYEDEEEDDSEDPEILDEE